MRATKQKSTTAEALSGVAIFLLFVSSCVACGLGTVYGVSCALASGVKAGADEH